MSDQVKKIKDQINKEGETPLVSEEIGQRKEEEAPFELEENKINESLEKPERETQIIEDSRKRIKKITLKNAEKVLGAANSEVRQHAKSIAGVQDVQQQIDKLVDLAQHRDPFLAIKVANHLDNNYVLDLVHDELLEEKVRKILIEKGLLKEV